MIRQIFPSPLIEWVVISLIMLVFAAVIFVGGYLTHREQSAPSIVVASISR